MLGSGAIEKARKMREVFFQSCGIYIFTFLLLVCVLLPLHVEGNYLSFEGATCENGTILSEIGDVYSPSPCSRLASNVDIYTVTTSTIDSPCPAWKNKPYVHFNTYSDANCNVKFQWNRRELSSTKTHPTIWGPAYAKCELKNGMETYFVEVASDGSQHNVYQTQKCLLDVNLGDRYHIVTCVRSSTSSIINSPGGSSPPDSNGTSASALENAFWVIAVATFCLFFT